MCLVQEAHISDELLLDMDYSTVGGEFTVNEPTI